jgi:hypothetical protein
MPVSVSYYDGCVIKITDLRQKIAMSYSHEKQILPIRRALTTNGLFSLKIAQKKVISRIDKLVIEKEKQ